MRSRKLTTTQLELRPLRSEDLDALFAIERDTEYAFFARPGPVSREALAGWLVPPTSAWADRPTWCVVFEGDIIGHAVLQVDHGAGTTMLGHGIARALLGQASELRCVNQLAKRLAPSFLEIRVPMLVQRLASARLSRPTGAALRRDCDAFREMLRNERLGQSDERGLGSRLHDSTARRCHSLAHCGQRLPLSV